MARILIVGHTYYPDDPRIRREAKALREAGHDVTMVCLRRDGDRAEEVIEGVRIVRLPVMRRRGSLMRYAWEYSAFFALAIWIVLSEHVRKPYDIVQVWNLPDVLVLAAQLPRLLGAKVVLDYRDSTPDTFASKYGTRGLACRTMHRVLQWLESMAFRLSDHVLTVHEPYRERVVARGVTRDRTSVFLNFPDPRLFNPTAHAAAPKDPSHFTLMYHGTVAPRFGIDIAIRAIARVRQAHPEVLLKVYGEGDGLPALHREVERLGLGRQVELAGFRPLAEIPGLILAADVGVVPVRRDALEDQVLSTKLLEYLAMGRPVIASRRPILERYLDPESVLYYEFEDDATLAEHIRLLIAEPARRKRLAMAGRSFMARYPWSDLCGEYLEAVHALAAGGLERASV